MISHSKKRKTGWDFAMTCQTVPQVWPNAEGDEDLVLALEQLVQVGPARKFHENHGQTMGNQCGDLMWCLKNILESMVIRGVIPCHFYRRSFRVVISLLRIECHPSKMDTTTVVTCGQATMV